jgi:tetratricopeptide (TPR) repeat protein
MLEPVRQYAAERLHESGECDRIVRRHLEWALTFAVKAAIGLMRERRWSAPLRDEQDNIRQALEHALGGVDPEAALRIAAALGYPWRIMVQPHAYAWIVRALEAAPGAPHLIRALALSAAGMLASNALDYDQALVHARQALAISRTPGARRLEGLALMAMGCAARGIDVDARPAAAWFEDALQAFREVDEPVGIGGTLGLLAEEQLAVGDLEGAASRAAAASDLGTRSGLRSIHGESRRLLAIVAARRGQHADAERLLEEAAAAHGQGDDLPQLVVILTAAEHLAFIRGDDTRGAPAAASGAPSRARRCIGRADGLGRRGGRVCPPPPRACT